MVEEIAQDGGEAKRPRKRGWYLILLSVLLIIAIGALFVIFKDDLKNTEQYDR